MADAPSLGDFFAKKQKKKIKGSNLNVQATSKPDASKKPKAKDAEAEGWQEEEVVAATMKVEVAGKLTREEDKKEEEDTTAHAWARSSVKAKSESSQGLSDRRFPTLAKSVRTSTNINIDDGSQPTVNISTSKNVFAALDNEEDDEDAEVKRPKEIKPAMVQKKKGEREKVAIQREVDKYVPSKDSGKKKAKEGSDDEDEDDEAEEKEDEEVEERKPEVKKKSKRAEKEADAPKEPAEAEAQDEDCKIVADLEAAKAKYEGRKKPFPAEPLPRSELEAEKENKPQPVSSKKKKMAFMEEELDKPKLQFWED